MSDLTRFALRSLLCRTHRKLGPNPQAHDMLPIHSLLHLCNSPSLGRDRDHSWSRHLVTPLTMEEKSRQSSSPDPRPEASAQYAFQVHDQSSMMSAAACASKQAVKAKRRRTRSDVPNPVSMITRLTDSPPVNVIMPSWKPRTRPTPSPTKRSEHISSVRLRWVRRKSKCAP